MQTIRVNDTVYHVRKDGPWDDTGAGPIVVFSNSLGTDLRVWDPTLPHLPASWRLFRYDTAGHGLSGFPGAMPIEDHARDLAQLMRAAGIDRAVVVGLSVGGLIGQALVKAEPDLVRGLVLCDTACKIGDATIWNDRIEAVDTVGLEGMADAVMERWFSSDFRSGRPDDLALWRTMLTRTPGEAYKALSASIRDADFTADTAAVRCPVLAVAGTEDGATPPDVVRATAERIAGAVFHEIPGAGHLPCVEAPGPLAELLMTFVEENNLG